MNGGTGGALVIDGYQILGMASDYTGGTTVNRDLTVSNTSGSATGTGTVQVGDFGHQGVLEGGGTIAGMSALGPQIPGGAVIWPSRSTRVSLTLTVQGAVAFHQGSSYEWNFDPKLRTASALAAHGVTIDPDTTFVGFSYITRPVLPVGTVFTVINNTSTTPISGTLR